MFSLCHYGYLLYGSFGWSASCKIVDNATFCIEMQMYYFWIRKFYKMTCILYHMLKICTKYAPILYSFSFKKLGGLGLGLLDKYDFSLFVLFWWSRPCLSSSCGLNFIMCLILLSSLIFFAGNFVHADKELGCEFAWKIYSFLFLGIERSCHLMPSYPLNKICE